MGADRINGRDVQGIGYVVGRIPGGQTFGQRTGVAALHAPLAVLDADAARAVALLLLDAASVDLVGAARKARERFADPFATEDERRDAMHALASELAKLEGGG